MKPIMGIDPGTRQSAYVIYDPDIQRVLDHDICPNDDMLVHIEELGAGGVVAVEMFNFLGQKYVGREVFTTVMWVGRFVQRHIDGQTDCFVEDLEEYLVYRMHLKMNICGSTKVKDGNIRQSIIDRFGGKAQAVGLKKTPGPLYGLKSHEWQAMAVALTYSDRRMRDDHNVT